LSQPKSSAPRIAYIDIETAPILANVWTLHEANAIWVERDTFLLCFAVMWDGFKTVKTFALPDYKTYQKDKHNDKELVGDLFRVLDSADIIVAHNGDAFDIKKINARLAVHGFPPPSPFKTIDTLKLARRTFKFDSNKLDNIGRYIGCGRKIQHSGADLWRECIKGSNKSWIVMRKYNAHDVKLLHSVYQRLKPWAKSHDLRVYSGAHGCPTCLSTNIQRRGVSIARTRRYQRYHCQSCGHWFSGELLK
jgi:DNA polymerase elongation subunit (family B)